MNLPCIQTVGVTLEECFGDHHSCEEQPAALLGDPHQASRALVTPRIQEVQPPGERLTNPL